MTSRRSRATGRALADLIGPLLKVRSAKGGFTLLTITARDCGA